jgi:exosome complex exonuclease DIS3/RRP44
MQSENLQQGVVFVSLFDTNIAIVGAKNLNRSFNMDTVAIELLPQKKWLKEATGRNYTNEEDEEIAE